MKLAYFGILTGLLALLIGPRFDPDRDLNEAIQAVLDTPELAVLLEEHGISERLGVHSTMVLPANADLYLFGKPIELLYTEDLLFRNPAHLRLERLTSKTRQQVILELFVSSGGTGHTARAEALLRWEPRDKQWRVVRLSRESPSPSN